MGKRGPTPKPTILKIIDGNPGKRPLNMNEPQPTKESPTCPAWMPNEAKKEWKRVVPELERMELLTLVDMAALTGYCVAWARFVDAEKWIKINGTFYTVNDKDGQIKSMNKVPQVAIVEKSLDIMRAFCKEFGFTPSSRSGIVVPKKEKPASKFSKFGGGSH